MIDARLREPQRDDEMARLRQAAANPKAWEGGDSRDVSGGGGARVVPTGRTDAHREAPRLLARSSKRLGDELAGRAARMVERDQSPAAAEWALAAAGPDYARAFAKLARDPVHGHREFTAAELDAYQHAQHYARSLNLSTGSAMVPTHLDPSVMLSSDGSVDPVRQSARVVTLAVGSTWHGVSSEGITSEWLAEEAEAADASPTLADPEVPTHKASAFVPISCEAFADMANVESEMRGLFADSKAQHEAPASSPAPGQGSPTGQPHRADHGAGRRPDRHHRVGRRVRGRRCVRAAGRAAAAVPAAGTVARRARRGQ